MEGGRVEGAGRRMKALCLGEVGGGVGGGGLGGRVPQNPRGNRRGFRV